MPKFTPVEKIQADVPASLVVFLVALPLCLGVALASGAPLIAGVISGAVGGIVVGLLSPSHVSVSGPAAGLTTLVVAGIQGCGDFPTFCAAVMIAGIVQIAFSWMRLGSLASLIPSSVITGMLTAIGLIIVLKQIPHGLGRDADYEGDFSFFQITDHENTFTEIIKAIASYSPGVLLMTFIALASMIFWEKISKRSSALQKLIPGPLIAVVVGVVTNAIYQRSFPAFVISQDHLVSLPAINSLAELGSLVRFPNFNFANFGSIVSTAMAIAVVASIETLLSMEGAEKIDTYRRSVDSDKELFAQGVGNFLCGLVGGIPLTSVVVRTSANVFSGSKSKWSTILHGVWLTMTAVFFWRWINMIPLGALAAVLFLVGYKLAGVHVFRRMYALGVDQFLPFMATVITIVMTDILTGVFAGVIVSTLFVLKSNKNDSVTVVHTDENFYIRFTKDVSFVNKVNLKRILASIPNGAHVLVDGSGAAFIDHDIFEVLNDFEKHARFKKIHVRIKNMKSKQLKLFGDSDPIEA